LINHASRDKGKYGKGTVATITIAKESEENE